MVRITYEDVFDGIIAGTGSAGFYSSLMVFEIISENFNALPLKLKILGPLLSIFMAFFSGYLIAVSVKSLAGRR